jgi:hypothetical protein
MMLGVVALLWIDSAEQVDFVNAHKVGEHTWTEFFHILFSALIALVFYRCGQIDQDLKSFTTAMVLIFVASMVREWEDYFHSWHPFLKTVSDMLVPVILVFAGWRVYRTWNTFVYGLTRFFNSIAVGYFVSGTVILLLFSRIYGTKGLWLALMEDGYMRTVKNASQETIESLGFVLILASALEYRACLLKQQNPGKE